MHGYLSSKEAFTAQIAYFSKYYKVTAIDFLGFGQSAPLTEAFSVDDYAEWTEEVLSALGVVKPHLIAHSFGCRVAVKMAGKDRCAFDKILLTGPAGVIIGRGFGYKLKVKTYRLVKRIAPNFAKRKFGSKEYRSLSPLMQESYKKIVNEDLRGCAQGVLNEVLIVEGTRDSVTTMADAKAYERAFPRARLETIEGGHFAVVENPVAFNLLAEEFFL